MFANLRVKDAIVDRLRTIRGTRPSTGAELTGTVIHLFWKNEDAEVFSIVEETQPAISGLRHEKFNNSTTFEILDECLKFTEKKERYYKGNRNKFICLFANNANRWGIFETDFAVCMI